MKEQLLGMLAGWVQALAERPLVLVPLTMIAALIFLALIGRVGARLAGIGALSSGPVLIVSGLITLGLCLLWAAVDAVFWVYDAPYLSERIVLWLAPGGMPEEALRGLIDVLPGVRLLLPSFVALPIAMFAAGTLHGLITWIFGGTLAEMIALEQKPEDVIAREDKAKAAAAGQPATTEPAPASPLADDRLGRIYKRFGHWTRTDQVELRFLRWQRPLVRALIALAAIALVVVALRDLPIPLWVGIAVLLSALRHNARKPPKTEDKAMPAESKEAEADRPAGPPPPFVELPELANRLAPAPSPPPREPRLGSSGTPGASALLVDIVGALGVGALWAHQAAALEAHLDRRSVLLATAPASGRSTFADALVLYALLADAERVLYLCPDRDTARVAAEVFAARARATHWTWNLLSVDLCERAGAVDPELSVPSIVFADLDVLHRRLLASQDRWREFLCGLGLIVVPAIDRYSGVPAAHLSHLFRRLDRAVRRSRTPTHASALLDDDPGERVRVFATCDPGYADVGRYAERIAARSFVIIGPERDAAPVPAHTAHILVPPPTAGLASALHVRDLARRNGFRGELFGYEDFTDDEIASDGSLATADIVVARMSAARYAALPSLTEHLGAPSSTLLWQPDREPVAEHLATTRPPIGDARFARGRLLVAHPRSPALERVHLRATVAEAEVTLDQLSAVFSRELLADELAALRDQGHLVERERALLDPRAGSVVRSRTVRLASRDDVHRGVSFAACATPFELVERSTGKLVAELDGARAVCAAYPRRVLVRGGRRYLVLPAAEQDQLERRRIACEAIATPALTAPIRRLAIEVVERRERRHERGAERRRGSLLALGGAGFWLQTRDVRVDEKVYGTRTFDLDGHAREEIHDEPPIRCEYATRAALLVFPAQPFGEISAAAMHALVHLLRATLPTALHHEEEDLEVASTHADVGAGPCPAIAFVDLHQEGAGFADAITLDLLRSVFLLSRDVLASSGDRALAAWTCRAPADLRALDAPGAMRVLDTLLGNPPSARPSG